MFFDYSWMHLRPLSAAVGTGVLMFTSCRRPSHNPGEPVLARSAWSYESMGSDVCVDSPSQAIFEEVPPVTSLANPTFDLPHTATDCYTSTMLVFRNTSQRNQQDHRAMLRCLLSKYEVLGADGQPLHGEAPENFPRSDLVQCIDEEPDLTGGAMCIRVSGCERASE